jgi:hypothetical protein
MKSKNDSLGCLHQNTPIYPVFHGDSQRPRNIKKSEAIIHDLGVNLVLEAIDRIIPEIKPESLGYIRISSRR